MTPDHPVAPAASARRRLIRGAFGAPAVLALHGGSAFAASNTCVANQLKGTPVTPTLLGDLTYARAPLFESTSPQKWYLSGAWFNQVLATLPGVYNATGIASNTFREVRFTGPNESVAEVLGSDANPSPAPTNTQRRYLVLRFKLGADLKSVDVVGVFDSVQKDGTAIAGTCWFSFEAAAKRI